MTRPVTLFTGQWADLPLQMLAAKARAWGYDGLELACWGDHFDVRKALSDPGYCRERRELLRRHDLDVFAISNHLVGQAVCDRIDERHKSILPPHVWGDGEPEGVRRRAADEMKETARAAARLGVHIVPGFTGSSIWHLLYSFPPVPDAMIDDGYRDFADRWNPILDVFDEVGVRFALEVHPTEIAFDAASAERALDTLGRRPAFGFNYDASHFGYQGVDYIGFIERFGDRIYHAHMKDVWWSDVPKPSGVFGGHLNFGHPDRFWDFRSIGRGRIDFEEIVRALNRAGYDGPLSVEWEDIGMDREFGAREACARIKAVNFPPSDVAFDAAFDTTRVEGGGRRAEIGVDSTQGLASPRPETLAPPSAPALHPRLSTSMPNKPLGVGFIGSGFNAKFHILGWIGVRDGDVLGVWSPNRSNAEAAAAYARKLDVGNAKAFPTITDMVADPAIDAIWVTGPNHARVENFEEIVRAVESGRGTLKGIACEKPLARNVAEAKKIIELAKRLDIPLGYLENQVFTPQVETGRALLWARGAATTGRPYLARAAEEHSGPHMPWFWRGELQGGGVLNDMMCHSALVVRHLLTKPGAPLSTVKPVRVTAHIASLKWSRPQYAKQLSERMGKEIDYTTKPSEDFASTTIEFETDDGHKVFGEATTSWSFVGAGLRLSAELLGPEYSMAWNSLDTGLKLFFSREVRGAAGEDLVEKQNAEMGLMPVVASEAVAYGYEAEDRHFCRVFLGREKPRLTFDDGLEVVQVLMTAYQSAEAGKTLEFPPKGLDKFVPAVARGAWKP